MTREQEIKGEKQYSRIKEIVVVLLSACNLAKKTWSENLAAC